MLKLLSPKCAISRLATLLVILFCASCSNNDDQVITLKAAHGLSQSHPVHQSIVFLAERLKEISGGTMQIEIYSGGQLGDEQALMELLQIGSLAMTKVSASPLEAFVPEFKIFSLPYVFEDQDHFWSVLDGPIGKDLLEKGSAVRLRGLTYYDGGSRSFYTINKPITHPDDLAGMKIRVQKSITSVEMIRALGGSATPIDWGELYTALQQGVVDGAENNPPSFYRSKHYEVCRYFSLDEHTSVPDVLLISLPIWDRLTPQQQQWLQLAADDSSAYQRELWRQETQDALRKLEEDGVTIIYPDKTAFSNKVKGMKAEHNGTSIGRTLDAIAALAKHSTGEP